MSGELIEVDCYDLASCPGDCPPGGWPECTANPEWRVPCEKCAHRDGMLCDETCPQYGEFLEMERGRRVGAFRAFGLLLAASPLLFLLFLAVRCGR